MTTKEGENLLAMPVGEIAGIGKKSMEDLAARGIFTLGDLVEGVLPNKYYDYRNMPKIADLMEHEGKIVTVRGQIKNVVTRRARRHVITAAELTDETGAVKVTWFNQPYIEKELKTKPSAMIYGKFGFYRDSFGITSPKIIDEKILRERGRYVAAYRPINNTLSANGIGKMMYGLRGYFNKFPLTMPSFADYGIWPHFKALYALHFAENDEQVQNGKLRMAFERLFIMYLAGEMDAFEMEKMASVPIDYDEAALDKIIKMLPFAMTEDQKKVTLATAKDLVKKHPTNRLIQGDVGSGKTAVAFVLAVYTALRGHQAVILAPTSVLAMQHYESFGKLFGKLGLEVRLLTGASQDKQQIHEEIADGRAQIVIGTTAILSDGVEFSDLALAVVDEQQRFGVGQRLALMRGETLPHLVSMTATPIPRSLFLAHHGNLEISNIRQKPKGRAEIESRTAKPIEMTKIHKAMRETLARGEQIYYVCPRISEDEGDDSRPTLEREFKELKTAFKDVAEVDYLHGGLDALDKDQKMWDFYNGKTGILVATSVIEVGVDNPNATMIVIRDADTFGLSQLHQLRGRVGRGEKPSLCYFVAIDDEKTPERLVEGAGSMDGFLLAEMDLDRRKIGKRIEQSAGLRQHGKSELLTDEDLMLIHEPPEFAEKARAAAGRFMAHIFDE
ncbi:DEAD/DEAH box helicase, partial [Candidatus Saccharibacteria bacterium]|nr:DEAD/DEAH box helicase [Candidatus Saccharibacteria bacterium]